MNCIFAFNVTNCQSRVESVSEMVQLCFLSVCNWQKGCHIKKAKLAISIFKKAKPSLMKESQKKGKSFFKKFQKYLDLKLEFHKILLILFSFFQNRP
jgi:hypothetical protein